MDPKQTQEYTESHFQIYEKLRKTLMELHMKGLPGADKMLQAMEKIHIENMTMARDEGQMMGGMGDMGGQMMGNQMGGGMMGGGQDEGE